MSKPWYTEAAEWVAPPNPHIGDTLDMACMAETGAVHEDASYYRRECENAKDLLRAALAEREQLTASHVDGLHAGLIAQERDAALARVAELERAIAERHTTLEIAATWAEHGANTEREAVVAWLRTGRPGLGTGCRGEIKRCADAIAAGEHRKGDE